MRLIIEYTYYIIRAREGMLATSKAYLIHPGGGVSAQTSHIQLHIPDFPSRNK